MTIRSWLSSIMGLIGPEYLELFALEFENLLFHFVYTLASTNINQSAPNLVKICMTLRSRMGSIMGLIGPEHLELFTVELEKFAIFHFVYTLESTNINLSESNFVKINMTIRSWMSSIIGLIGPEHLELFALE